MAASLSHVITNAIRSGLHASAGPANLETMKVQMQISRMGGVLVVGLLWLAAPQFGLAAETAALALTTANDKLKFKTDKEYESSK
jgi:hypothetical protein